MSNRSTSLAQVASPRASEPYSRSPTTPCRRSSGSIARSSAIVRSRCRQTPKSHRCRDGHTSDPCPELDRSFYEWRRARRQQRCPTSKWRQLREPVLALVDVHAPQLRAAVQLGNDLAGVEDLGGVEGADDGRAA